MVLSQITDKGVITTDQAYFNTIEEIRKPNRHLSLEERGMIQALKQQGYSMRKIAAVIGCAHTTIMYEQRHKDINKASVEKVYRLAKVFGCAVEDLIEH